MKKIYKVYLISEDGLLKNIRDEWDRYDHLFTDDYQTEQEAEKAINEAAEQGRLKGFYQAYLAIIPVIVYKA